MKKRSRLDGNGYAVKRLEEGGFLCKAVVRVFRQGRECRFEGLAVATTSETIEEAAERAFLRANEVAFGEERDPTPFHSRPNAPKGERDDSKDDLNPWEEAALNRPLEPDTDSVDEWEAVEWAERLSEEEAFAALEGASGEEFVALADRSRTKAMRRIHAAASRVGVLHTELRAILGVETMKTLPEETLQAGSLLFESRALEELRLRFFCLSSEEKRAVVGIKDFMKARLG